MKRTLFAFSALLITAGLSQATPILYTESATATGNLGGTAFTNALVTLTFLSDTTNVTSPFAGYYENAVGTAMLTVAGIGTTSITTAVAIVVDQNFPTLGPTAGLIVNTTNGGDVLDDSASGFSSYAIKTAISPTTGSSYTSFGSIVTGKGNFSISAAGNTTFSAVFEAATAPEPATSLTALFGFGIAGLFAYRHRSRRS